MTHEAIHQNSNYAYSIVREPSALWMLLAGKHRTQYVENSSRNRGSSPNDTVKLTCVPLPA